ncbi:MAG: prolyl-tRNA synthetase associated domain-containing protein [Alphaproteobacteria bacterium]|jgi:Ala-tRNA(Pro) deacylase|nr:prolyl-tRNA synthetase associated domain-containing protein [Alphaproteobacteria bacterium]
MATPADLYARFAALGIAVATHEHEPVFTVEESRHLRGLLPGGHVKNLFLRNKKGRQWLVTCEEERAIDLKKLGAALDAGRLSFGSADRLRAALGVEPGAVTPFAILNDPEGAVQFVLDRHLLDYDVLNAHPLVNDKTVAIARDDLLTFVAACGHTPHILDLDPLAPDVAPEGGAAGGGPGG